MNMKLSDLNLLSFGNSILMTGVIFEGEGKTLLCFLPGESEPTNVLDRLDMDLDDWTKLIRQTDIMETEILQKAKDGTITKAILRKSQRQIDAQVSWKVFRRDGYRCRYCGRDDAPLTVDHLILWEEGGPSIEQNLVSSCKKDNKARGNTQYRDWLTHPHYVRVSAALDEAGRQANRALLETLDKIPKAAHLRSR
jgi:hypothetical protein